LKLVIIIALTAVLAISAVYFNLASQSTENSLNKNYDEINILVDNILDACTRPESIPTEACQKGALEVISGCNELSNPPSVCKDPRLYNLSIGITAIQNTESKEVIIIDNSKKETVSSDIQSDSTKQRDIKEIDSVLFLAKEWLTISSLGRDASITVPITMTGLNAVHNLSILGGEDSDVIRQWDFLISDLRSMNSEQISDWIQSMKEKADSSDMSWTMVFFDEQMLKAEKEMQMKIDRESGENLSSLSPDEYLAQFEEHKQSILTNDLILENHYPIRDKMVEYMNTMQNAIQKNIMGVENSIDLEYSEELMRLAKEMKYEIDGKFIAEKNK
jgi:hypothetical protein